MAEEFNTEGFDPKEIAKQLRQPHGETGREVGLQMNKGNKFICLNTYKALNPERGNRILEIGMGNGFFIKDLLGMVDDLLYTGVDFSDTMVQESRLLNKEFIDLGRVCIEHASIEELPFDNSAFDCITTTNTLYFWPYLIPVV